MINYNFENYCSFLSFTKELIEINNDFLYNGFKETISMKKKEYFNNFVRDYNYFICPICHEALMLAVSSLKCNNGHNFDISSKGIVNLINTSKYKRSEIYNKDLFLNRREFILNDFYSEVYDIISEVIKENKLNKVVLDAGCGEASHGIGTLKRLQGNTLFLGFDYSKDAIDLASDYYDDKRIFFEASVDNIPLMTSSVDVIIDFLSPFNMSEFKRILKPDGVIIKVSPAKEYLKELRKNMKIDNYSKEDEIFNNINDKFLVEKIIKYKKKFKIDSILFDNLMKMTPIKFDKKIDKVDDITIDLNIYVLRGD